MCCCCLAAAGCRWLRPEGGPHSQETHSQRRGGYCPLKHDPRAVTCLLCADCRVFVDELQMISPLNFEQAVSARDALAKAVYGRTFNWLVEKINQSLTLKVQEQLQKLGRCAHVF